METDNSGSFEALEAAMRTLEKQRLELEEIWETRKLKLDLCLQLRLFERDALEVRGKETDGSFLLSFKCWLMLFDLVFVSL
jgi:hypothetical protein